MADLRAAVEAMLAERYGYGRLPAPPPAPVANTAALIHRLEIARALDSQPCHYVMIDGRRCNLLAGHEADGLTEHDPEP